MNARRVALLAVLLVVSVVAYLLACSHAAWSPDGKRIAFVSRVADEQHLYVASADGGKPRLLWKADHFLSGPAWSSDGRRLLVFEVAELPPDAQRDTSGWPKAGEASALAPLENRLWEVDVESGTRRRLARQHYLGETKWASEEWGFSEPHPQWADDGKTVVWPISELEEVRLLRVPGDEVLKRFEGVVAPVVSPSGRLVAALADVDTSRKEGGGKLVVIDLATLDVRTVLDDREVAPMPPAWSPDSTVLLAVAKVDKPGDGDSGPTSAIWRVPVGEGKPRRLFPADAAVAGTENPLQIAWSPKGDLLAVTGGVESKDRGKKQGQSGIWLMGLDGSGSRRIDAGTGEDWAYHPTFSPDGKRLCYRQIGEDEKLVQTVVFDIAEGKRMTVPVEPSKKAEPDTKPDEPSKGAEAPATSPGDASTQ